MNVIDKIKDMVKKANGTTDILNDSMLEEVMPKVIEALNDYSENMFYKITYNRPSREYPSIFYTAIYQIIRVAVLDYLEENHPHAWFKPMYFSDEKLKELMNKNN